MPPGGYEMIPPRLPHAHREQYPSMARSVRIESAHGGDVLLAEGDTQLSENIPCLSNRFEMRLIRR